MSGRKDGVERDSKTERERERERNVEREVSDLGWKWVNSDPGLAAFWWRSVVVQKSSSARRQCVRWGP